MTVKEIIPYLIKCSGKTHNEVAELIGWTGAKLDGQVRRDTMKANQVFELMDKLGYDLAIVDRETGKPPELNLYVPGDGPRVRAMVDRVIYDTAQANALSNNFYADGVNKFTDGRAMELYVDGEGRYFFADYSNWEGAKDRIIPVPASEASAFIAKYGTEIHKGPKE